MRKLIMIIFAVAAIGCGPAVQPTAGNGKNGKTAIDANVFAPPAAPASTKPEDVAKAAQDALQPFPGESNEAFIARRDAVYVAKIDEQAAAQQAAAAAAKPKATATEGGSLTANLPSGEVAEWQLQVGTATYTATSADVAKQQQQEAAQKNAFRKEWRKVEATDWLRFGRKGDQIVAYLCPPGFEGGFASKMQANQAAANARSWFPGHDVMVVLGPKKWLEDQ